MKVMNFCILGAGAWGTAVAVYLSKMGHSVSLVLRRMDHARPLFGKGKQGLSSGNWL